MKKIVFILMFAWANITYAQTTIEKIDKTTQKINNAIEGLGGLFKKKDKTGDAEAGKTVKVSGKSGAYMQGGKVAPNAKYIDADRIYPFNHGAAVVLKGSSYALIDTAGNFIIPYNKYSQIGYDSSDNKYRNGIFWVSNPNKSPNDRVYINFKGILLTSFEQKNTGITDDGMYVRLYAGMTGAKVDTYIDCYGQKKQYQRHLSSISEDIGVFYDTDIRGDRRNSYYKGLTKIAGFFDEANPFKDGMAIIGNKDQFGVLKYGYINNKGEQVIDFIFTKKPENFSEGFAKVYPKDDKEFDYAFINKKGEVVYKHTRQARTDYGDFDTFTEGMCFSSGRDAVAISAYSPARYINQQDIVKAFGLPVGGDKISRVSFGRFDQRKNQNNKILIFEKYIKSVSDFLVGTTYGYIDLEAKKLVEADFVDASFVSDGLTFDPVSQLAYVKVYVGNKPNNNPGSGNYSTPIYREGYINRAGTFVLIKAEQKSTW